MQVWGLESGPQSLGLEFRLWPQPGSALNPTRNQLLSQKVPKLETPKPENKKLRQPETPNTNPTTLTPRQDHAYA